jgi:DhnA family fructose-bisphosphate aldolase class Ia
MKTVGKEIRLGRFFDSNKNLVVTAVDHGAQMGTIPGIVNLPETIKSLGESDGILVNAETLNDYKQVFMNKKSPSLLARVTWTTAYCFPWKYDQGYTAQIMPVENALAYGADLVTACGVLQTGNQEVDRDNIKLFTEIVKESDRCGIPIMGEAYPVGADYFPQEKLQEQIGVSCRILWELGADVIKTFYTGPGFGKIVESVGVPILVLGAEKKDSELSALEMAQEAVKAGARGVVFGRNIFQSNNPPLFLKALKEVVNKKSTAKASAEKYGLN